MLPGMLFACLHGMLLQNQAIGTVGGGTPSRCRPRNASLWPGIPSRRRPERSPGKAVAGRRPAPTGQAAGRRPDGRGVDADLARGPHPLPAAGRRPAHRRTTWRGEPPRLSWRPATRSPPPSGRYSPRTWTPNARRTVRRRGGTRGAAAHDVMGRDGCIVPGTVDQECGAVGAGPVVGVFPRTTAPEGAFNVLRGAPLSH